MRPVQRRAAVVSLHERFGISQRRACQLVGAARSTVRYRRRDRGDGGGLRARLRERAAPRPRFGSRRLHALVRREGFTVNHKRLARLYREEGLAVRCRNRKALTRIRRGRPPAPARPNQQWALDFLADALASGRKIRLLRVLEVFTRQALSLAWDTSLPGCAVVRVLDRLGAERGLPDLIVLDHGPELISRVLEAWAHAHGVALPFIDPGKPVQHAHCESCHGRLRDECRNEHWFLSLGDARWIVEAWRQDDNRARPHSALGDQTPAEYAALAVTAAAALPTNDGLS